MMYQNRFKSKVLWLSLATQLLAMLISLGVIDVGISDVIKNVIISVCEMFVAFGILNNPTDSANM